MRDLTIQIPSVAFTLLTLGVFTDTASAQHLITTARADYASAAGARGVTAEDFNRDGWTDVAVANHTPDGVSVLLNQQGTGFTASFIGGSLRVRFLSAIADMNLDGLPDIVTEERIVQNRRSETNSPPEITFPIRDFRMEYSSQFGEEDLEIYGGAVDHDFHAVQYEWRNAQGTVVSTWDYLTVRFPPGVHEFTVTASDGRGGSVSDTFTITIDPTREIVMSPVRCCSWPYAAGTWQEVEDPTAAAGRRWHDPDAGKPKRTAPEPAPVNYLRVEFVADHADVQAVDSREGAGQLVGERLCVRPVHRRSERQRYAGLPHRHDVVARGEPGGVFRLRAFGLGMARRTVGSDADVAAGAAPLPAGGHAVPRHPVARGRPLHRSDRALVEEVRHDAARRRQERRDDSAVVVPVTEERGRTRFAGAERAGSLRSPGGGRAGCACAVRPGGNGSRRGGIWTYCLSIVKLSPVKPDPKNPPVMRRPVASMVPRRVKTAYCACSVGNSKLPLASIVPRAPGGPTCAGPSRSE
jgi:VCBS repeat protein